MSVHPNRVGGYDVRYRDASGKQRSKSFRRERDAKRFDVKVSDAKQTGALGRLDGGRETLDAYVEQTWAPIHAAQLAPKTQALYTGLYDGHVSPTLGGYPLRELSAEVIGRWQADRLAAGAPVESTRKALTLLGGILQRAVEAQRIPSNPQRLVRRAAPAAKDEVRPLAPATVEAVRARMSPRGAIMVSLLAYAGLRPQEARGLRWEHVLDRTLVVHAPKTRRHSVKPRSVRLLAPLAHDLREWRMACGRPGPKTFVLPGEDGGEWTEVGYEMWRAKPWRKALTKLELEYQVPYACRHSFASLLLHEGRSVIYVARQLGHSATLTLETYGHVVDELEEQPQVSAEAAIEQARRGTDVLKLFGRAE